MHIPDSAISPATSLITCAAMVPVWYAAARRLRETLATRRVPLLAAGAAFCFTIMMFNLPVPGGTTVHATGAVLLAVLLGPWAAVLGMTVTLAIQALLFADGGVLAAGANCLAMAFAMPFAGYAAYRLAAGRSPAGSGRRALAAGIGAYVGINSGALVVAVILGLQPVFHHDASGRALYFPFGLGLTVPAMMLAHLTVAGLGEAALTTAAVRYLQTSRIPLAEPSGEPLAVGSARTSWAFAALGVLIALTPLGLLARGSAWGEWSLAELTARAGHAPAGLADAGRQGTRGLDLLPGYLSGHGAAAYVLAALAGAAAIAALILAGGRILGRGHRGAERPAPPSRPAEPGSIPSWMRTGDVPAAGRSSRLGPPFAFGLDFVEKSLADLAESARASLVAETWARRHGLLQRLDPRAKVAAFLGFVLLAAFLRAPLPLAALVALASLLAALSCVPLGVLHRRVWLTVPLAVGAVTLPAALSVVTPGREILVVWTDPRVAVTAAGLAQSGLLALRVGVALSFVVLLALTTPWSQLMRGLAVLGAPRSFLAVLAMTYRYLGLLSRSAAEVLLARKSRTVGRGSAAEGRGFLGRTAGALVGKTLYLGDEVHAAMIARGFDGEARALAPLRLRAADAAWLAAMSAAAAAVAAWGLLG